jgi:transposase-like protein
MSHENVGYAKRTQCTERRSRRRSQPALSPRQLAAIVLLFSGRSYSDVVRQLKVDRKTLFRWRHSAPFIAEINRRYLATTQPRARRDPQQQK